MSGSERPPLDDLAILLAHVVSLVHSQGRTLQATDRADVIQDALLALFRHESRVGPVEDRPAWLGAVVRNLIASKRRSDARRAAANPSRIDESVAARSDAKRSIDEILADACAGWTDVEKRILQGLAAGERRRLLAAELGISADAIDRMAKKNLERLRKYFTQDEE